MYRATKKKLDSRLFSLTVPESLGALCPTDLWVPDLAHAAPQGRSRVCLALGPLPAGGRGAGSVFGVLLDVYSTERTCVPSIFAIWTSSVRTQIQTKPNPPPRSVYRLNERGLLFESDNGW